MKTINLLWAIALFGAGCGSNTESEGQAGWSGDDGDNAAAEAEKDGGGAKGGEAGVFGGDGGTRGPDGGKPTEPITPAGPLAVGLTISEIAVFQSVKISIAKGGAKVASRNAPVVANREALVRVYVTPGAAYKGKSVTAELRLTNGGSTEVIRDVKAISGASTDAALASTFNFTVSGAQLAPGVQFSVSLTDPTGSATTDGTAGAQYPAGGKSEVMDAQSSGAQLKVVLVPVQYNADGSGRLPDTSAAQVERYRQALYSLYPAAKVDISVHAPVPTSAAISSNGNGFSTVLQAMVRLRAQDGVAKDVYYYGIFAPTSSFSTFCRGGCVTGLSGLATRANDAGIRASVGHGFSGGDAAGTAAHEIGHAHGRSHAPGCGAAGADSAFPYSNGGIGAWGYDLTTKKLINPTSTKDFMGYCSPPWVSDYNYKALFDRMRIVNGATFETGGWETARPFRIVGVEADGSLSEAGEIELHSEPSGEDRAVTYLSGEGRELETVRGHFYEYDHLPGGFMLVPSGPKVSSRLRVPSVAALRELELARPSP